MDYKFITEAEKAEIVDNQLRSLEANHFALALVEPSKFQQQDAHLQWKQQIQAIENYSFLNHLIGVLSLELEQQQSLQKRE